MLTDKKQKNTDEKIVEIIEDADPDTTVVIPGKEPPVVKKDDEPPTPMSPDTYKEVKEIVEDGEPDPEKVVKLVEDDVSDQCCCCCCCNCGGGMGNGCNGTSCKTQSEKIVESSESEDDD